jgi:protein tyrosine phosphatase (PTP) superfamily phosphohydrolase (DUF442 family)
MNNELDLQAMSGENNVKSSGLPRYDEITLDGNYGMYKIKHVTQELVEIAEDGIIKKKYPTSELGNRVELVWLKVRRQLVESNDEGLVRQTNEHNTKSDVVTVKHWTGQADETMVASSVNGNTGKYPKMKVRQIIYALDLSDGKVYRLISKGMSNSMKDKPEDAVLFFDYIFNMPEGDHFYTQTNVMEAKSTKTKVGLKYYSHFTKGRDLTEDEMEIVKEKMKEVHDSVSAYDASRSKVVSEPQIEADASDDVNIDDIPF